MTVLDLAAGAVIASVFAVCIGAVVFSAAEAGRGTGRSLVRARGRDSGPGGLDQRVREPQSNRSRSSSRRDPHTPGCHSRRRS